MFILKAVHLQTSQRLFSKQGALMKFVNGSMMESMATQYATANQMNVTQLRLWRLGYKMEVYVSFTFFFIVFNLHFVMISAKYPLSRAQLFIVLSYPEKQTNTSKLT